MKKVKKGLRTKAKAFLDDIIEHPLTPTTKRYNRLTVNPREGNQIKEHLGKKGLIFEVAITTKSGRIKLLQLTEAGVRLIDPKRIHTAAPNPSLEHQYFSDHIRKSLEQKGYCVKTECPLPTGGVVDLLGQKGNRLIAIEVETGKSDVVANIDKCIAANIQRIIIAATTAEAKHKVEFQLAKIRRPTHSHIQIIEARYLDRIDGV